MTTSQPTGNATVYVSFSAEISAQTSEALLGFLGQLVNKGARKVYLLLSSPGGSVTHGVTLYNTLRALPIELTTHNVGSVNSIANMVFLAGNPRYASTNSTFMFHGVGFDVKNQMRFEEKILRERLDGILADQKKIASIISERTNLEQSDVEDLFRQAVTRDPDYALSNGVIDEIREASIPAGAAFHQLVFKR